MKVRLVKKQTIIEYVQQHSNAKKYFDNWMNALKIVDWRDTHDIKDTFNSADFLGRGTDRVVFNIGGNRYRLICNYFVGKANFHLYINWLGTHAEYTRLCDNLHQYTVNIY